MVKLFSSYTGSGQVQLAVEWVKNVFLNSLTTARMHHVSGAHGTVKFREGWTGRLQRK